MHTLSKSELSSREDAYLSRLPISIIQSWYQREGYIRSMADLIEKELQSFSRPEEVGLILALIYLTTCLDAFVVS